MRRHPLRTAYNALQLGALLIILGGLWLSAGYIPSRAQGEIGSGEQLIRAYYGALNLKQYKTAYDLWVTPPQGYAAFVAGFSDTAHIDESDGALQNASGSTLEEGRVPVVLISHHTDQSLTAYYGCFAVGNGKLSPARWAILSATIHTMTFIPDGTQTAEYLTIDCYNDIIAPTPALAAMFDSYFALIDSKHYDLAYKLWIVPPQPFAHFAQGYAKTVSIVSYSGEYQPLPPSMTTSTPTAIPAKNATPVPLHESGRVPLVIVAQTNAAGGGTTTTYYTGCYGVGQGTVGPVDWRLFSASLHEFNGTLSTDAIQLALHKIDCYALYPVR